MPNQASDDRRRGVPRRSQGRAGESRGISQGPVTSQGRRPAQARGGSASQYLGSRGYQSVGNRRGSNLRQHNINFNNRRRGILSRILGNPRALIALAVLAFLVMLLVFGVTSCVRGCQRSGDATASSQDPRIAAGLSPELTDLLIAQLDHDALMTQIAANADKIEDERLVKLALRESDAVPLVAGLLEENPDLSAKPYGSDAARGAYPKLYDWDLRWGYTGFGDGPLALTGSGPYSLAMAYIGLTGQTDHTPADIAGSAAQGKLDTTYGLTPDFVKTHARQLGLSCEEFTISGEALNEVMESGTVVIVQVKAGTFGDEAHWLLVVGENLDGSVNLNDPTSPANTARPWDPASVANAAQSFQALSVRDESEEEQTEGDTSEEDLFAEDTVADDTAAYDMPAASEDTPALAYDEAPAR